MQKNKVKAVLFDIDGVIINSDNANRHFINAIIRSFGKKALTKKGFERIKYFTVRQAVKEFVPELTKKQAEITADKWSKKYFNYVKHTKLKKGIKKILTELKGKKRLAVVTNRTRTSVLKFHKVIHFFEFIVTSKDVKKPKPSPEGIKKVLRHFRLKPEQAIFVGDTIADFEAGKKAGVKTIIFQEKIKGIKHIKINEFEELKKFMK